uniref:Uncharacterized protein n=1 Tax=Arundo donax TaxID=35708 RepID=A0A0A9A3U1_ARUDO
MPPRSKLHGDLDGIQDQGIKKPTWWSSRRDREKDLRRRRALEIWELGEEASRMLKE